MRLWSHNEVEFLETHTSRLQISEIADKLNRSYKSVACKLRRLKRRKPIPCWRAQRIKLNSVERAYLAGLFDGEGTVFFKTTKGVKTWFDCEVGISNTDYSTLLKIQKMLGSGKLRDCMGSKWKPDPKGMPHAHRRRVYSLKFETQEEIHYFLRIVIPYLKIKRREASLMLKFLNLRRKNYHKHYRYTGDEWKIWEQMHALKEGRSYKSCYVPEALREVGKKSLFA